MKKNIVGVRFQDVGKLYHFDATGFEDLRPADFVVVNTSRGLQLGQITGVIEDPPKPPRGSWKKIERKATPSDLVLKQILEQKELEALIHCRALVSDQDFEGLKIVKAEYSFDGEGISIFYNTEEEGDVDLSSVLKDMKKEIPDTNIEFLRMGPRDVAKSIGGMGACGMVARCCSIFLTEFSPISIRMAKAQGVSLDPSEITGMCGRLRCCLIYEYEQYVEARKELPKKGKRVLTPLGEGKVIDAIPIKKAVLVKLDDGEHPRTEFLMEDIQPLEELRALQEKAKERCDIHGEGECDCKKEAKDEVENKSKPKPVQKNNRGKRQGRGRRGRRKSN